ncbi:uncharacterized protein LOC143427509 isoform X3 [Xylocopa sonorina]|uniref:uncharacterized protein LOC143427509 isoform X3 n=1 Tax=Xylocopa sonorina TaxID=1818115 RepID=UPI00403ACF50
MFHRGVKRNMCDSTKKMKDSSVKNNVKNEPTEQLCRKESADKRESMLKSTNEDVQRAIEGLKEIPDEELQEFLDDEDFMQGLDVVDAWEGDEEKGREVELKTAHIKDQEQKRPSRERHRRDYKGSNRERPKREEKKHEEIRRDPSKSTKDIERDKIRTKRDNESKLLAEKEKAIKHLLDSDNVVPPGTETEAIQSITERQNMEQAQMHGRRSRERRRSVERQRGSSLRRRTPDRIRVNSPRRKSPLLLSPERRSPFKISNERHRSPLRFSPDKRRSPRFNCVRRSPFGFSPERRRSPIRRLSWERRTSTDRRWSAERHRRRTNIHERRRSRSRDRQRSRSMERLRRKASRSPIGRRYSPRRRSRTRSRSMERRRKRSPFINELNRQLRNEAIMTSHMNTGYTHTAPMEGIPPMMNNVYQPEGEPRPPLPMPPYIHQSGLAPPMQPPNVPPGGPPFMNFENSSQPMNFDPVPMHPLPQTEYVSGPVMYNQSNTGAIQPPHRPPLLPAPVSPPQHEPSASTVEHVQPYNSSHGIPPARQSPIQNFDFTNKSKDNQSYRERRFTDSYNGYHASQEERLKTPEPPVISDTKQFEKTSLSSLLEASVSAKDSASLPVLYPGFKPEILRHCEHALRELPMEDPRLKMKGRFFYDPTKENVKNEQNVYSSNSILLQKSKSKIYWDEEEGGQHLISSLKQNVQMHQKICQTDELETSTKFVQASVTMIDFEVQVYPQDLQHAVKEEKRPIMDRLDWNVRETFDYTPKFREADDLRWSLSNSSQKRTWSRNVSPSRRLDDREHRIDSSLDHSSRNIKLDSPIRSRDSFSGHKGSVRDHYVRERYSPNYRHSLDERDDFHENRSDHSRGESPMMLEDSAEELELEHTFQRGTDWHGRGKMSRGRSSPLIKPHVYRGKHSGGRSYRGRGGFRGKF